MSDLMKKMLRAKARSTYSSLILIILAGCALPVGGQQYDKPVEAIRRQSQQINEQIAESERAEEGNGIYCNELVINKRNKSWPAVGIYRTVISFYYTFGDREQNPYPNRLLKITVTTNRSARHEYAEYIFNPTGRLIFYYERDSENLQSERRYYFASERLIRRMTGPRMVDIRSREALEAVKTVLTENSRLKRLFLSSLD